MFSNNDVNVFWCMHALDYVLCMQVGHYVADIFDPETSTWFHCDDDVVSVLPNAGGVSVDVATSESSSKASKSTKFVP